MSAVGKSPRGSLIVSESSGDAAVEQGEPDSGHDPEITEVRETNVPKPQRCCTCWVSLMNAIQEDKSWWSILVVSLVLSAVIVAQITRDLDVVFPSLATDDDTLAAWTIPFLVIYAFLLQLVTATYVLRLCALGWDFFKQPVNYVDVSILVLENILNIVVWSVVEFENTLIGVLLPYLLIRYVLKVKPLRVVILALLSSFKTIAWTIVTLMLVIFAFCQMSLLLFSEKVVYFESTLDSMMTMVQVMSGDAWASDVAKKTAHEYPKALVYFYFLVYYFIVSVIVLNVVTAVFMDAIKSKSEEMAASRAPESQEHRDAERRNTESEFAETMLNPVVNQDSSRHGADGIAAVLHELEKINRRLDTLESKISA